MFYIEVRHQGLGKYRHIKGKDRFVVEQKAAAQKSQWDDMWERRCSIENTRNEKLSRQFGIQSKKDSAKQQSDDAIQAIKQLDNILLHTLDIDDKINWETIKDNTQFSETKPSKPAQEIIPSVPDEFSFYPKLSFLDHIFSFSKKRKIIQAKENYQIAKFEWDKLERNAAEINNLNLAAYKISLDEWNSRKTLYETLQSEKREAIDWLKRDYLSHDSEAIAEYCDIVLSRSQYPDYFPQQFDLIYVHQSKTLVVEYVLPHISVLPKIKDVSYIQSKDEFKESYLTESQLNKIYDKLLYDISLRTIHEVMEADTIDAINAVAFNGFVNFISPATGKQVSSCILSLHVTKKEFESINLAHVESKICFKTLKGVGSSKLHSMTPIVPILKMDKIDKRFVDSHNVSQMLDESTNLAMLDWQEFEHLVREIFEYEFASNGGEVKVTQASRDGGVDAIIFDPDPIRGGKIVVQAKRYANVVGVSSVRDLYGTVMNEGANKGILITTSDYGPDAYTFAKDKPLTLLNGGHLLHLLEKHGRKARIDLVEAKKKVST